MKFARLLQLRRVLQVPLAKLLNVRQPTISRWAQGESVPRPSLLPQLEKLLGAKVDYSAYAKHQLRFRPEPLSPQLERRMARLMEARK